MTTMNIRQAVNAAHAKQLDTKGLRDEFLLTSIFSIDEISMTYSHVDRVIVGGIYPVQRTLSIGDEFNKIVGADYFLQRREIGFINVGGDGVIEVDGKRFEVANEEALYVGCGSNSLSFTSVNAAEPAKFYFNCTPAHQSYPTKHVTLKQAVTVSLGTAELSNERTIYKLIVPDILPTCQLVMGLTKLKSGSNWNTMPCHTHERRMEVYFYFNMNDESAVFHMMGEPTETRHLVVHNEQAVISPSWSIHSGVGTQNYSFIWGMCGENQLFDDMDHLKVSELL